MFWYLNNSEFRHNLLQYCYVIVDCIYNFLFSAKLLCSIVSKDYFVYKIQHLIGAIIITGVIKGVSIWSKFSINPSFENKYKNYKLLGLRNC